MPDAENDLRKQQLRELALLNGTLRENDALTYDSFFLLCFQARKRWNAIPHRGEYGRLGVYFPSLGLDLVGG